MTFEDIEASLPKCDVWQYLSNNKKPVVMYGMGNGADKIIAELDKINVCISDFFASDGFVRGQLFHGKKMLSFSDIKEKYNDFIILVSFGSEREDVIKLISDLDAEYELYLPDVPVAGENIFNFEFYIKNRESIKIAFELLADDLSKEIFGDIILYKLTGKIDRLLTNAHNDDNLYKLYDTKKWRLCVDAGAYRGDSAEIFNKNAPDLERIIAIEPDKKNFKKLLENTNVLKASVEGYNVCAWKEKGSVAFDLGGNRNSSVSGIGHVPSIGDTKEVIAKSDTIDNILNGRRCDFIKFDVEGSESAALDGSVNTLKNSSPDMLVSIYHRSEDIFSLVVKTNELLKDHKLYIRRKRCLPAWEISLLAVKHK
ncbi:MAG: FkbM family methyltransferase [Ruminococcaceae bacterium]|nr:FkbM family methyltransferase [Oscillospiraceae bacterium]